MCIVLSRTITKINLRCGNIKCMYDKHKDFKTFRAFIWFYIVLSHNSWIVVWFGAWNPKINSYWLMQVPWFITNTYCIYIGIKCRITKIKKYLVNCLVLLHSNVRDFILKRNENFEAKRDFIGEAIPVDLFIGNTIKFKKPKCGTLKFRGLQRNNF